MGIYEYLSVALSFGVTLVVTWVLLLPLFSPQRVGEEWCEKEASDREHREEILSLLQELEGDKASGKLTPEEYQTNRAELLRELIPLLEKEGEGAGKKEGDHQAPPTQEQGIG